MARRMVRHIAIPDPDRQQLLLARHPQLVVLPKSDWERAAAHLDDADAARLADKPCPWCYP